MKLHKTFLIIICNCVPVALIPSYYNEKVLNKKSEKINPGESGCMYGGIRFTTWIDQKQLDGIYTPSQDTDFSEKITCFSNPAQAVTLTSSIDAHTAQCPNGGIKLESFTDIDSNGNYDSQIDSDYQIKYICNGAHDVTLSTTLNTGDSVCHQGGLLINTFTDINNNGTYEPSIDINSFTYKICHGQKALIINTPLQTTDTTCPGGGSLLESCIDSNGDSVCTQNSDLNYSTQKICNGSGSGFFVVTENPGTHCPMGGYQLNRFQDRNNNGVYDSSIDSFYVSNYICNGLNWLSKSSSFLPNAGTANDNNACPLGGVRFEFGYDHVNSSDGSYYLGTDGVLDTVEIVSTATSYSCNAANAIAGPLITKFQNDSEGTKARFYWEIQNINGSIPTIKLAYASSKLAIQSWNCEDTLTGVTVINDFSNCTDTTYRTSSSGILTNHSICGFDLTAAPFSLNPWDYRYFKLCAQNTTTPNSRSITNFRVAGNVPSGMVMVHLDDWPIHEFANTNVVPFTYAIDKWETYLSSGSITNGLPGGCTSTSCISTTTGVLSSSSGQTPVGTIDWYASRKGCANRTAAGYTGATTQRTLHLQTEMENFVATYGTPDDYFVAFGNQVSGNTAVISSGYLGCNNDLKHVYNDNTYTGNEYFQTGDIGTKNCISRYGARDMIGNFGEFTDGYYEFLTNNTTRQKSIYWGTADKVTTVISDTNLGYTFPISTVSYFTQDWDYQNLLPKNSVYGSASMPSMKFFGDFISLDFTSATRISIKDILAWASGSYSGRFSKSLEQSATVTAANLSSRCAIISP